jgi:hypothetical protein
MRANENTDAALTPSNAHEFSDPYRAGYEAGYASGREMGFKEGYAAVQHSGAVTPVSGGKPASRPGPRRMLLGYALPQMSNLSASGRISLPELWPSPNR